MRVALLPTGRTEWRGFAGAFSRLFPKHEFYCLPTEFEVRSNPDGFPYPGFTSVALSARHEQRPPESARELVSRAAQEALGDRRHKAADLVFIIDDVELPNMEQVDRVVAVMRRAVLAHLDRVGQTRHHTRTELVLREKVSFHLIAPMIEAWFFADPNALDAVGVPAGSSIEFAPTTDPEAFATDDAGYLAATESDCPTLAALSPRRKKKLRPKWLGSLPRERHPKGYLQWLCRDAADRSCTRYSETAGGGPALAGIEWASLLGRPATHFALLRALAEDLADGLDCAPEVDVGTLLKAPPTVRSGAPHNAVLRNI